MCHGSTTKINTVVEQAAGPSGSRLPRADRHQPPHFDAELTKQRNLIERFFNKLKHFRRIATRTEMRASNDLAMIKLAAIRIWLRNLESMA